MHTRTLLALTAASSILAAFPAAAAVPPDGFYVGSTSQGGEADFEVKKGKLSFDIEWTADCRDPRSDYEDASAGKGLRISKKGKFGIGATYAGPQVDGQATEIKARIKGKATDSGVKGTYKATLRILEGKKVVDTCRTGKVKFDADAIPSGGGLNPDQQ